MKNKILTVIFILSTATHVIQASEPKEKQKYSRKSLLLLRNSPNCTAQTKRDKAHSALLESITAGAPMKYQKMQELTWPFIRNDNEIKTLVQLQQIINKNYHKKNKKRRRQFSKKTIANLVKK